MHTTESNFLNFVIEYIGEIKTEFENTLPCLSEAQMASNHEKKLRSKISWHTPFQQFFKLESTKRLCQIKGIYWNIPW